MSIVVYNKIKAELLGNVPLYGGMTNIEAAIEMNAVNKPEDKAILTGAELWEATDAGQFGNLTEVKQDRWIAMCAIASVNPFGPAEPVIIAIFGGVGGDTLANLQALRVRLVSRTSQLGLGRVREGDVKRARII